jgi:D-threonate/D-erythronate kinase
MTQSSALSPQPSLAILADDLTGACDAAVSFAARGVATVVVLEPLRADAGGPDEATVRGLDADTRRLAPRPAATRTAAIARLERSRGTTSLYKKIDSTLRGHVGAELGACLRAWKAPLAVLCPAFPAMGRWVQDGRLHVDGRGDVGAVADLVRFPRGSRIAALGLDVLERGVRNVALVLEGLARTGARVVVADANAPPHLTVLAEAAAQLDPPPLLVGSAGLARALAGVGGWGPGVGDSPLPLPTRNPQLPAPGPWLVVAGSQAEATALQVAELERAGACIVPIDADGSKAGRRRTEMAGARAARLLADGVTPVLRLVVGAAQGQPSGELGPRAEDRAVRTLGHGCRATLERACPAGLFLTGGLTARACLLALGVNSLRLQSEPLPGIARGRAIGGACDGRAVITKAGGFGAPDALRRLVLPG